MSKQHMTIQFGQRTVTVKTNSEKAIKNALGKVYQSTHGTVKSFVIKGDVIEFEATTQKEKFGYWKPTDTYRARITENTFATEETAEVVEAPAAEVVEARIVEDVDASYDDDAIDEALDAIRDAVIAGRPYARLIEEAHGLGCSRYAISDVIREAKTVNA